jgi:hypothetical protein
MADINEVLVRLKVIGRSCLVTYHVGHAKHLYDYFLTISNVQGEDIRHDGMTWNAFWWRNDLKVKA